MVEKQKFLPPKTSNNKEIVFSFLAHLVFFAIFYLQGFFNNNEKFKLQDLETQSIRVDMVALPDKMKTDISPTVTQVEPSQELTTETTAEEKPTETKIENSKSVEVDNNSVFLKKENSKKQVAKTKQSKALEKLKKQSALDKIKSELQAESIQKVKNQNIKGNQVSKGNALTGLSRLTAESYSQSIKSIIRSNWALPNYLKNKNLSTIIDLRIDASGYVISKEIYRSSGNTTFDDLVISTIERSNPLPKPPDEVSQYFLSQGYRIEFKE